MRSRPRSPSASATRRSAPRLSSKGWRSARAPLGHRHGLPRPGAAERCARRPPRGPRELEQALVSTSGSASRSSAPATLMVLGTVHRRDGRSAQPAMRSGARSGRSMASERPCGRPGHSRARTRRRPGTGDPELTATEQRIAELIASGLSYRETADALFISPKTVQWNLSKIYRKLGISSRSELPARLATSRASSLDTRPAGSPPPLTH